MIRTANLKIADNVKAYKEINHLSIRKTAEKIKVNTSITNQILKSKRNNLRLEAVYNIARSLNVSIDDLLYTNIYNNIQGG